MEARIARLEADMEYVKRDVGELRADVAAMKTTVTRLDTKVGDLPGKGFVVMSTMGGMALFGAFIAFAEQIKALFGA